MGRYQDYLRADCGLTFAEYLGIEIPKMAYSSYYGWRCYSYRGDSGIGHATQKAAKCAYRKNVKERKLKSTPNPQGGDHAK